MCGHHLATKVEKEISQTFFEMDMSSIQPQARLRAAPLSRRLEWNSIDG